MKKCRICNQVKEENEFYKRSNGNLRNECKNCLLENRKKYYKTNKPKILNRVNQYYLSHKEERQHYIKSHKEYYQLKNQEWKEQNPEYANKWQQSNRNQCKQYSKKYNSSKHGKEHIRKYEKEKYQSDEKYRLKKILRIRFRKALKSQNAPKYKSIINLLGCSLEDWKNYLIKSAQNNYNIKENIDIFNGSNFHIDHIIPLSSFDLTNLTEQQIAFHYTNTQILTSSDNILKGDS